jgi:hypothetical protein
VRWADLVDEPVIASARFRPEGRRRRFPRPRRRRQGAEGEGDVGLPDPMILAVTPTRLLVVEPANAFMKARVVGSWPRAEVEVSAPGGNALVVVNHSVGRSLDVIGRGRGADVVIAALQSH